ncbi:Right handed beta helix region [Sphingobacterium nematocida]|uniref:Right handed beta helix region n=2 Tax=Sphingobacterium nematocida TaxID=1513896 RepID=A0A1T5AYT7_9SPHI|nr:Right handed beta helix region [Sphingobacterium nematocida]
MYYNLTTIIRFTLFILLGYCHMSTPVLAQQSTTSKKIYISLSGSDRNPGTRTKPYASPQAGLDAASKLNKEGFKGQIELILMPGKYYLDKPIQIDPSLSGTAASPFTIRAHIAQDVTLSGAKLLKLHWEKTENGLWKATVPKQLSFQELFADGNRLVRARYPNFDAHTAPFNGYAADAISPERTSAWKDPKGAIVHALHVGRWGGFHYRVLSKDANGKLTLEGGSQNNRPSKMHDTYRYVENVFEELDSDLEWYLDESAATLYYRPKAGKDPNQQIFEAPILENIITITGTESKPVHDINIEGIRYIHTAPTFMKTAEPLLRSDWTIYRQGAIKLEGAVRCTISNSDFSDLGGNAVFISNYNRAVVIRDNLIERIGAGAINFVGGADAVRSPSFRYENFVAEQDMDTIRGPKTNNYPTQCEASGNLIRHIGLIEKQVAGVQIAMASAIRVYHNTIYQVPRAGINIGDGTWGGHDIAFNDVFHTVLETSDHGAFNSWGRDRFWHPNRGQMDALVAKHPEWILLDAVETTLIHDNRFQCDHGWDIDLDDGSSNYRIFNNLCLSGGLKLREGFYRTVYNNIMINNGFHPHVWFKDSHDTFRHNIVMQPHQDIQVKYWGDTVDYNFYTLQKDLEKDQAKGIEKHAVVVEDIQFKNASVGDFSLDGTKLNGYTDFDMSHFGVNAQRLRVLADQPEIPKITLGKKNKESEQFDWKEGRFKSVETLGEQSAAGLPTIAGVLVVKLAESSILYKGGLRIGDVIVGCQDEAIQAIKDFQTITKRDEYHAQITIDFYRNQVKQTLVIKK